MTELNCLVEGLDRIDSALNKVLNYNTRLRRVLRIAVSLRDSLEDRLDEHCQGECEKKYTRCFIQRQNNTSKEYYELECKAGNMLYSRMERQAKRIKNLREAL